MSTFNFTGVFNSNDFFYNPGLAPTSTSVFDEFEFTVGDEDITNLNFTFAASAPSALSSANITIFNAKTGEFVTGSTGNAGSNGGLVFNTATAFDAEETYRVKFTAFPAGPIALNPGAFDFDASNYQYSLTVSPAAVPGNGIIASVNQFNTGLSPVSNGTGTDSVNIVGSFTPTDSFKTSNVLNPLDTLLVDQYRLDLSGSLDTGENLDLTANGANLRLFNATTGELITSGLNAIQITNANFGNLDLDDGFVLQVIDSTANQNDANNIPTIKSYDLGIDGEGLNIALREFTDSRQPSLADPEFGGPLTLNADNAQLLYVAYYGRPADPSGLNFWEDAIAAQNFSYTPNTGDVLTGADLDFYNSFTTDFGTSTEATSLFANFTTLGVVEQIYQQAFDRPSDTAGRNFWTEQINLGNVSASTAAIEIALGATGTDRITLNNKISSADLVTTGLGSNPDSLSNYTTEAGRNFLDPIAASVATQAQVNVFLAGLA
ncbi:DUF4214 domain-containing protein [Cyanobacterium sp. IPPAS B-1200]|uniref:DUF4214 domain-containing protein n=1 Tax=Cyanobacterium sp. IPPAS B-1200 TaxID=1562720 RepID=UPI000852566F|nr:DUF4214 domain-containing protein [Cyanobacterium sp. IPPAS B-1200]OEJ77305.1 hypothetical protein A5482_06275 [Cyanobacterium sp. IPPAS B-1200]